MKEDQEVHQDKEIQDLILLIYGVLKKRLLLIVAVFVVVSGYGVKKIFFSPEKSVSKSTVVFNPRFARLNNLNIDLESVAYQLVSNLTFLIENKDYEGLSKKLKLEQKEFSALDNIECFRMEDFHNGFNIDVTFYGIKGNDSIVNAIVDYINNSEFVALNTELVNQKDIELFGEISGEVKEVRDIVSHVLESSQDPKGLEYLYPELLSAMEKENDLKYQIKLDKPFYLSENQNHIIIKKNYFLESLKFVAYATFLSLVLVMLLEFRKVVIGADQKQ